MKIIISNAFRLKILDDVIMQIFKLLWRNFGEETIFLQISILATLEDES